MQHRQHIKSWLCCFKAKTHFLQGPFPSVDLVLGLALLFGLFFAVPPILNIVLVPGAVGILAMKSRPVNIAGQNNGPEFSDVIHSTAPLKTH